MVRKLFDLIQSSGTNVYLPAKKTGKCTEPYAVVKEEKTELNATGKSAVVYFTVSIIVPLENYALLSDMESRIKSHLKDSSFKFKGSANRESDGDTDAYIRDLSYTAVKRVSGCVI